jgi:Golgi nucleoside diphosphatase
VQEAQLFSHSVPISFLGYEQNTLSRNIQNNSPKYNISYTTILYYHGVSRTRNNTLISKFQLHLISKRELMKVFENKSSCYVTEHLCITSLNVAYFSKICYTYHIRTLSFVSAVSPSLLLHASGCCYC